MNAKRDAIDQIKRFLDFIPSLLGEGEGKRFSGWNPTEGHPLASTSSRAKKEKVMLSQFNYFVHLSREN